jgi:hypothetical protein
MTYWQYIISILHACSVYVTGARLRLNNSDFCAGQRNRSRWKFDRLLGDVVALRLPQVAEREVGGRRTETE